MKIAVIASNSDMLRSIQALLEKKSPEDQCIYLLRQNGELHLERLDLFSTNVLVLDVEALTESDLKAITTCTREHHNPAIVYLSPNHTKEDLERLMHAGVSEALELPIDGGALYTAIEQIRSRRYISSIYHPRGKVLTFISCKGGAGATFLSTNLAYILACEFNKKVLFVDVHMQDGDASFYVTDQTSAVTLGDIVKQVGLDSTVIASASMKIADNFFLLQAPENPEKAAGIAAQHIDTLITLAIQDYDYVILDISHDLDAINMKALDRADGIYPVFQPMVNYLRAVVKQLRVFSMLGYPEDKIHLILNRMDHSVSVSTEEMEETINRKISKIIPNDFLRSVESVNTGIPIGQLAPSSHIAQSLRALCQELVGGDLTAPTPSWFKKVFSSLSG